MIDKTKITNNLSTKKNKLNNKLSKLNDRNKQISLIRLTIFLIVFLLFLILYVTNYKNTAFIILSVGAVIFIYFMLLHSKIEKAIKKVKILVEITKENLARLEIDWKNIPQLENEFLRDPTFLEQDLNITEKNGLLRLIFNGSSLGGIKVLRDWLDGDIKNFNKITFNEIVNRQHIVSELKKLNRFRERLLLTSRFSFKEKIFQVRILSWLEKTDNKKGLKAYTIFLSALTLLNYIIILLLFFDVISSLYLQIVLLYFIFYYIGAKYIKDTSYSAEFIFNEIKKFVTIFEFIEDYNFAKNKYLTKLTEPFKISESSPKKIFNKISFSIELLNLRANPIVWFLLMSLIPIDYLLSIQIDNFKKNVKNNFPVWLNKWYELEAYCALANFAYLNPDYTFPNFIEKKNCIEAIELGHPLICSKYKVINSFEMNNQKEIILITGSNMSGKSTFLRTVGINILLAYSGSVVNAANIKLSKFQLYSCIKVSDSIVDGISYFYSEVKRLKYILNKIKKSESTSLVLIDEIYKGTNNVERVVGSKALIKNLAKNNVFSIISTHDLELVNIAEEINKLKNYHFKEIIKNNEMSFDYKIAEGPCPTTNALKIMKLEGLPT
ncbi:MAG: hypothetical protein CR986_09830 [Ignavibacteriae bacterium]|nr:MAG: hypothetical protein CR986_09830 [Ignavibacteriota bacterium]